MSRLQKSVSEGPFMKIGFMIAIVIVIPVFFSYLPGVNRHSKWLPLSRACLKGYMDVWVANSQITAILAILAH